MRYNNIHCVEHKPFCCVKTRIFILFEGVFETNVFFGIFQKLSD